MPRAKPAEPEHIRQQGTGSIFFNAKKNRMQATIDLGRKASGKRDRKTFTAKLFPGETQEARDEVAGYLSTAIAERVLGTFKPPSRETVKGYLTTWLEQTAKVGTTERTWTEYQRKMELYVYPVIGAVRLNDLQVQHVQAVYSRMAKTVSERTHNPLSPSTIRAVHRILHPALGERIRWSELRRPKVQEYEAPVLEPEEFTKLMAGIAGHRYELVWLLLAMGLRPEEVLGLKRSGLDFRRNTVTVDKVIPTKGKRIETVTKTQRSRRTLQVPEEIGAKLAAHCETNTAMILRAGGRVFNTSVGTPLNWSVVSDAWRALMKTLPVPYVPPYSLRHGFASYLIDEGVPLTRISADLGHSNTHTTAKVYAHKLRKTEGQSAEVIGRLLPLKKGDSEQLG